MWTLGIFNASPLFINWLDNLIKKYFSAEGRLYCKKEKGRKNSIYVLKFGKITALRILEKIYYPGCLALERKLLQAKMCLQYDGKMVNYTS